MNNYYVYEHIRNDNNQCFYVGKGRGKRANNRMRNEHHNRVANKYGMHVKIIADHLSEEEALFLEEARIRHYVFKLGYGIDIIGYNNNENENGHLTNQTFGGDGSNGMVHSEEWRKQHSIDMTGENNPAYGVNYWETFSEDKVKTLKERLSKRYSGKNNPMYGVSPEERMDKETYSNWKNKLSERLSKQVGEANPNYGNNTLHKKLLENPELKIQYYSRPGGQNGRARGIKLYDIDWNFISDFACITDCAKWLKENDNINSGVNHMITNIRLATENNKPYKNHRFKFV